MAMQVHDSHDHDAFRINSKDNPEWEGSCHTPSCIKMHYGIDHRVNLYMADGILHC